MATTPARPLTQIEKDRLMEMSKKSLPKIAPENLLKFLITEPDVSIRWDMPHNTILQDLALRQLLVAKAISELAVSLADINAKPSTIANTNEQT